MSNRIIKESICSSDSVDALTWFEEVVFYRMIVNCDDYGRTDARLPILNARLFPLKNVTETNIKSALNKLSAVGIVCLYRVDDKPFLQLVTWEQHQQVRTKRSKYPAPTEGDICKKYDELLQTPDIKCNQAKSNVPLIQSNPIQSESESEIESECMHGAEKSASVPQEPAIISLPLADKTFFDITQEQINHWHELYPAVNIIQELRKMLGWFEANPLKKKTRRGITRCIVGWLSKEQDKGGVRNNGQYDTTAGTTKKPQYGEVL